MNQVCSSTAVQQVLPQSHIKRDCPEKFTISLPHPHGRVDQLHSAHICTPKTPPTHNTQTHTHRGFNTREQTLGFICFHIRAGQKQAVHLCSSSVDSDEERTCKVWQVWRQIL